MAKIEPGPAFEAIPGAAASRLLLLCDHASNHVPAEYAMLGLAPREFERHIAYDIGARDVTLALARRLDAAALLTCTSRLLIDPNRGSDDPTLIMKLSDGAIVPGNATVDASERQRRIERFHRPYHRAITTKLDGLLAAGIMPLIISIHSFTPTWRGKPRPWHAGILWDRDWRIAGPMIAALRAQEGLVIGDNEPYSGALEGDTLSVHATARGLPHVLIEIRQDLIGHKSGVDEWAERLAKAIEPFMKGTDEHG